jgi:hypothetical protein
MASNRLDAAASPRYGGCWARFAGVISAPLRPADELADLHRMLDKHGVPRHNAGQELSLQGRVQEFVFMAAASAVKQDGRRSPSLCS